MQLAGSSQEGSKSGSSDPSKSGSDNSGSSGQFHYEVPGLSGRGSELSQGSGSQESPGFSGSQGSDKSPGSSDPSNGQKGSSSDPSHSSSDTKHTTTSSSRTGSSSVTWHETVSSVHKAASDDASDGSASRRKSSYFSEEDFKESDSSGGVQQPSRSSIRRFKEGSKVFAGFIEDADGLQPSDDMLPPMTWEEKCEIIEELCAALEKKLERLKNDRDGVLDGLQNYLDVAEHKMGMARKDKVEMHRNVIQFAELLNPSQKPYSEDMLRYLNGRILEKRLLKEKLEQRNRRLQKMVTTTSEQLEGKVDVKDLLHTSDIMELKDLNKELGKQLLVRSHLLNKSRSVSRRIVKLVKTLREDLQHKIEAKQTVKQSLLDRSPLVARFQEQISSEKMETEKLNLELLSCVKGEDMRPTALEYMKLKRRTKDLRRELYCWLAKVEIAELTNNQLNKHVAAA